MAGFCQLCQHKQAQYQDICTQKNLCLQCISYLQKQQEQTTNTDLQNTESTATHVSLNNHNLVQPIYGQKVDNVQPIQQRDSLAGKDQDLLVGNMKAPQTPPKGYQGYLLNMWQYQQHMLRNQQQMRQVPYVMGYYPFYPPGQPVSDRNDPQNQVVYPYQPQAFYNLDDTTNDLGINKNQMLKQPYGYPKNNGGNQVFYEQQPPPLLSLPQAGEIPQGVATNQDGGNSLQKRPFPMKGYEVHLDQGKKQRKERSNKKKEIEYSPETRQRILQEQEDKAREQLIMHQQLCEQYQPEEHLTRQERVQRYVEKKRSKRFQKFIRYESRKKHALIRPRIKGRFAKREEVEALKRLIETGRFRASKPMKYFLPDQDSQSDEQDNIRRSADNYVPQTDEQWNEVFNNLSDADWDNVLATM